MSDKTNVGAYLGLKEILARAQAAVPAIEAKISAAEAAQAGLDEAGIKAAALEDKNAKEKEREAERNRQLIQELRDSLPPARKKIELIEGEMAKIRSAAVEEIRRKWRPAFEESVKKFIEKAKKAADLEREVRKIRDQADGKIREVTPFPIFAFPPFANILIEESGPEDYSPLAFLIKDLKNSGILGGDER